MLKKLFFIFFMLMSSLAFADDTAALQALVTAKNTVLPAGHGTYSISSPIYLYHSLNLNGNTLSYTSSTGSAIQMTTDGMKISNGTIQGPNNTYLTTAPSGIVISGNRDSVVNMNITTFGNCGITGGSLGIGNSPYIGHSHISNTGYIGCFLVSSTAITGGVVEFNVFDRSMISSSVVTEGALMIRGTSTASSSGWSVHDNTMQMPSNPTDITSECYEHRYAPNSKIYRNTCIGGSIGISIVYSNYVTSQYNSLSGQNQEGLEYAQSNNSLIYRNKIFSQSQDGVLFDGGVGSNTDTLTENNIFSCTRYGFHGYTGVSGIVMIRNSINTSSTAIYLQQSHGFTLNYNTITGNVGASNAIYFDTSIGDMTVYAGTILGFTNAVYVYSASATVTDSISVSYTHVVSTTHNLTTSLSGGATVGSHITFTSLSSKTLTKYYVSSSSGNDANSGTSVSAPIKTLSRVSSLALNPGDQVLLKKGDTFTGSISISHSGSVVDTILFSSYGVGSNPILSGFETLSNWTNQGGGIWSCVDANLGTYDGTVNKFFINGVEYARGRFPKTGYNTFTAFSSDTSITDPTVPLSPSYVGGEIVVRDVAYQLNRATITKQSSGGVFVFTATASNPQGTGWGYFIQNSLSCLTTYGDWYFSSSTHTIYAYFGATNPNTLNVIASSTGALISFSSSQTYNSIKGLDFTGANNYGIYAPSYDANYTTVSYCNFYVIGDDAISAMGSSNTTYVHNYFNNINNLAIVTNDSNNTTVSYNTVNSVGMIPGAGESGQGTNGAGSYTGIQVGNQTILTNTNNLVSYNTVTNIGYIGISVNGGGYTCTNNFVNGANLVKMDGGGIYTYGGGTSTRVYSQRYITNNIVLNSLGNLAGTSGISNQAQGIYTDDNSSNITIDSNFVASAGYSCFFFHNSHELTVNGNVAINGSSYQVYFAHDNIATFALIRNITMTGNYFVTTSSAQKLLYLYSVASNSSSSDLTSIGTLSSNYYGNLSLLSSTSVYSYYYTGLGSIVNTNFAGWQTATAQESTSTYNVLARQLWFPYYKTPLSTLTTFHSYLDSGSSTPTNWSNNAFGAPINKNILPSVIITY